MTTVRVLCSVVVVVGSECSVAVAVGSNFSVVVVAAVFGVIAVVADVVIVVVVVAVVVAVEVFSRWRAESQAQPGYPLMVRYFLTQISSFFPFYSVEGIRFSLRAKDGSKFIAKWSV